MMSPSGKSENISRAPKDMNSNAALNNAEARIPSCPNFDTCSASRDFELTLSSIQSGDRRRGSANAKILLVTEAPDRRSGEGRAYSGSVAKRIMNFFLSDDYGICLTYANRSSRYFVQFLLENHIYVTSAVKCTPTKGSPQDIDYGVINRCREEFLNGQINALSRLMIIVALGSVAASSVLHLLPGSFQLSGMLGVSGRGIFEHDPHYGKKLVVLPHPSGTNLMANPPILNENDDPGTSRLKMQFRRALSALRGFLAAAGYELREVPLDFSESPPGYF